jgi:uncharacterized BrkB/YihY/UPF0761 family membrane protein
LPAPVIASSQDASAVDPHDAAVADQRRRALILDVAARYWNRGGPNWSAAVAFRLLLTVLPVALLAALVADALLPASARSARPVHFLGGSITPQVAAGLGNISQSARSLSWLAVIAFVWTGSTLFSCMETAASALYGAPGRPFVRQRVLGIGLMAAFVALLVLGAGASLLLDAGVASHVRFLLQPLASFAIGAVLYTLILHVLPTVRQRWIDVAPGVALAATGTTALNLAWPVLGRYVSGGAALSHAVFAFTAAAAGYVYIVAELIVLSLAFNATRRDRGPNRAATRA